MYKYSHFADLVEKSLHSDFITSHSVVAVALIVRPLLTAVKRLEQCVNSFSIQTFLSYRGYRHCLLEPKSQYILRYSVH